MRATMIIFHAPDVLEFAGNGCSLGRFKSPHARGCFQQIDSLDDATGPEVINEFYQSLIETRPENLITDKERTPL